MAFFIGHVLGRGLGCLNSLKFWEKKKTEI